MTLKRRPFWTRRGQHLAPLARIAGIRIGVLVQDRPEYLRPCFQALSAATRVARTPLQVCVFDDASRDERAVALVDEFVGTTPGWSFKRRAQSGGDWASSYRWAMGHLSAGAAPETLIGTLDSDVIGQPDWVDRFAAWAFAIRSAGGDAPVFFSAFNSSDVAFHGPVYLRAASPHSYLQRRRMGGAHLFCFATDLGLVGEYPRSRSIRGKVVPGLDDESVMTRRLRRRRLTNASMVESLVEHLGQVSILNEVRRVEVASAVYGLNQPSSDWPSSYGVPAAATPGLLQQRPNAAPPTSARPIGALVIASRSPAETRDCIRSLLNFYQEPLAWIGVVSTDSEAAARAAAHFAPMAIEAIPSRAGGYDDAVAYLASLADTDAVIIEDRLRLVRPVAFRSTAGFSCVVQERSPADTVSDGATTRRPGCWWTPSPDVQMWSSEAAVRALDFAGAATFRSAPLARKAMVAAHGEDAIHLRYAFVRADHGVRDDVDRLEAFDPTWALVAEGRPVSPPWLIAARWRYRIGGTSG